MKLGINKITGDCLECSEPFVLSVEVAANSKHVLDQSERSLVVTLEASRWSVDKGCEHVQAAWANSGGMFAGAGPE